MSYIPLKPEVIEQASWRIKSYITHTPIIQSHLLNEMLGHELIFKVEGFQKIGAFKIRGALNALLTLQEKGNLPKEVVTFSSGNHAQAVALACKQLGIKATIFMTQDSAAIKQQATRSYGADIILTSTRLEAENLTSKKAAEGSYFLHPYDHDDIIAGQGTACYEALKEGINPTAIFASCGGGGLLSGTYLAGQLLAPNIPIFAGEPLNANDASQSYRKGKIITLLQAPQTIADGARTLAISERTFHYLRQLSGFFDISENEIIYWTQWLMHLLKVIVEPTSAVAMAAVFKWLQTQSSKQNILIILSGGNIDPTSYKQIWEKSFLDNCPSLLNHSIN